MPQEEEHLPPDFDPQKEEEKGERPKPLDYSRYEHVEEDVLDREEEDGE